MRRSNCRVSAEPEVKQSFSLMVPSCVPRLGHSRSSVSDLP